MISVIIPFKNESASLAKLIPQLQTSLDELGVPYEVHLVSNGSTDDWEQLLVAPSPAFTFHKLRRGDKIVIAAKKQGSNDLKACAGTLGYSGFAMNNQFIECRQGAGSRTLIVKLVGQEEIKSWLAGSELLWGVRKATDTSTIGPTPDKSKGISVFTGRGPTGIVGNIKYSGETEQYVEIPFTIDL
ncbi:MAG: hypothetical protein WCJ70_03110 [bacterium]